MPPGVPIRRKRLFSRTLRLALQAPEIVEAILGGWADQQVILEKLERPLPMGRDEQRHRLMMREGTAAASTWRPWRVHDASLAGEDQS
jgi:hypothetical protein